MVKKVRVHTCKQRIEGYIERRCSCRRFVTQEDAEKQVDQGSANYVKTGYKVIQVEVPCPICDSTGMRKSCRICGSTGKVLQDKDVYDYGEDIYRTSVKRTPRTATIEKNHLEYAYIKGDKDAIKRIELYHELDQLALVQFGAELRDSKTGETVIQGTPEPEDNPKTGTGRRYDYGRTI